MQATSDWEEVCWLSDKDVDYLEVEIALGPHVRVKHHMMLAREDNFLFWADAILADEPGDIDYRLGCRCTDQRVLNRPRKRVRVFWSGASVAGGFCRWRCPNGGSTRASAVAKWPTMVSCCGNRPRMRGDCSRRCSLI